MIKSTIWVKRIFEGRFFKLRNIKHQHIRPNLSWANGEVETFIRNLGNLFRKIKIRKPNWRVELNAYLRNYRSKPIPFIVVILYSLDFKKNSPTLIPEHEQIDQKENDKKDNDNDLTDAEAKNSMIK